MKTVSLNGGAMRKLSVRTLCIAISASFALSGCASVTNWFSSTDKKILPLPAITGVASVSTLWQAPLGGKQVSSLMPAVDSDRVYAAHSTGAITVFDAKSGAVISKMQIPAGKGEVSGGVSVAADLVVVGTNKADVIAFDAKGAVRWSAKASSEVISPAAISDSAVIVLGGDGAITSFDIKTGERKWRIQRVLPALTVRSTAIPTATRGAVFVGTAQGKLLAIDANTGTIGWEATVATPKGVSELERLVDVVGQPAVDTDRVCAAAYQGRVACFDLVRGTLLWSREISSLNGPVIDARYVYAVDEKGLVHAFDKATGGTIWKQDVLAGRRATGIALLGDFVAVQDAEGRVHLVDRNSGKISGRGLGEGYISDVGFAAAGNTLLVQTQSGQLAAIGAR
jgi:outer membrane protein assembly factor BamB